MLGRRSVARGSEAEIQRKAEQPHTGGVVRSEMHDRRFPFPGMLHGHLIRIQSDVQFFCVVDDGVAEVVIRGRCGQSDVFGVSRGQVTQVFFQLAIGQLVRCDLPARADGEAENDDSEDECNSFHAR